MFASIHGLIAYIGPETVIPLTSILAAVGGAVMLFWNRLRGGLACLCWWRDKNTEAESSSAQDRAGEHD